MRVPEESRRSLRMENRKIDTQFEFDKHPIEHATRSRTIDKIGFYWMYTFKYICLCFAGVYEHIKHDIASVTNEDQERFPFFDMDGNNQTVFLGQTAHLHCTVQDIGQRRVSKVANETKAENDRLPTGRTFILVQIWCSLTESVSGGWRSIRFICPWPRGN